MEERDPQVHEEKETPVSQPPTSADMQLPTGDGQRHQPVDMPDGSPKRRTQS